VVMLTALDQKQTIEEAIRDGAFDFIVKPFERDRMISLLQKIDVLAASKTAVAELRENA
jgi:two-component system, chemotaxis family, chemotaxis protein CheY